MTKLYEGMLDNNKIDRERKQEELTRRVKNYGLVEGFEAQEERARRMENHILGAAFEAQKVDESAFYKAQLQSLGLTGINNLSESIRKEIREILREELKEVLGETTSYIDAHEEQEAKDLIEKNLGFPAPVSCLYYMHVKIHYDEKDVHFAKDKDGNPILREDGSQVCLYLPESVNAHERFKSCSALVLSQGPACYKGERFKYSGRSCKVGDWITIAPNEGYYMVYKGIPMRIITDDKCLGVVEDPTYVTRT